MRLAIVFGLDIVAVPAGLGAVAIAHPTGSTWIVETLIIVAAAGSVEWGATSSVAPRPTS